MFTSLQILSCYFHQSMFVIKLHIRIILWKLSVYSQSQFLMKRQVEFCRKSAYN